jgi:hypothetical protein
MLMDSPFPIRQIYPLLNDWIPATMLCHVKEAPDFAPALRIFPFGKYLAFNTLAQREFGSAINLHTYFANIARLKE